MTDRIKALEDALRKLELANDRVCGARPQRVYNLMIAGGMAEALLDLDCARADARAALAASQPAQPVAVKVKPLVWERHPLGCFTVKSTKSADDGCDVVYYAERAMQSGHIVSTVTKPRYFRCYIEGRFGAGSEFGSIEAAKAAVQAEHDASTMAALDVQPITPQDAARRILSDDIAISHMAQALHDGPLGADDYWFSAARPQGAWCVDAVRVVLRAIAEVK